MFPQLLFLVALLQFGESQDQCVREIRLLKDDIQQTVRNMVNSTCTAWSVTREDIQELVEDKATKKDVRILKREVVAANKFIMDALTSNQTATREDVKALNQTVTTGNEFMTNALDSNHNVTRNIVQQLIEDKAANFKEDFRMLKREVTAANQHTIDALASNQSATRDAIQAAKEDVSQRASEVVQALNHSVTTGNQEIVDILTNTKTLVEATRMAVEQEQCVTRDEVNSIIQAELGSVVRTELLAIARNEVQSIVRHEIQSLVNYVAEVQQNNTALLLQAINPGTQQHPFPSCKNIPQGRPSGDYWIQTNSGPPVQQYCDMTRTCCDSTGGWMRVANIDMTDPNQQCPSGFRLVTSPRRTCGRPGSGGGCVSTTFPVHGVEYSRVCGRVIGYQFGHPDAFGSGQTNIDSYYIEGVSLTHGISPRRHIWTFANAIDEARSNHAVCPCTRPDLTYTGRVPSFVGEDYFCETGSRGQYENGRFYSEDPLWDGQGCGPQSTCCSFNNPPWFCKQLPQPTSDDIELRLCASVGPSGEDSPLEIVEIYVQ